MSVDAKRLGATLLDVVRAWVEPAFVTVCRRIEALEQRAPVAGPKGDAGDAGADGRSAYELARAAGFPGSEEAWLESLCGAPGEDGKDGADGRSVTLDDIAPIAARAAEEAVAKLPAPKDGKDGESVHPDTVRAMVAEQVRLHVAEIPRPRDGEPGRDATAIEYRDGIDESKSYPRGTHALHRGGVIVAMRATDPLVVDVTKLSSTDATLPAADLTAAGWAVAMNGTHTDVEESLDEGRTIRRTLTMTNGKVIVSERKTSIAIYRGVWLHDREYSRGDLSTRDGSVWHCEAQTTTEEPGRSPAWKLAVKRGNHGRDGKDAKS